MHTYTHLHAEQGGTRENEQLQLNFTNTASSQHGAQEIVTSIHKNNSNNGKSCQQKGIYRIYIHYVHWLAGRQARTHTLLWLLECVMFDHLIKAYGQKWAQSLHSFFLLFSFVLLAIFTSLFFLYLSNEIAILLWKRSIFFCKFVPQCLFTCMLCASVWVLFF